MDDIQIDIRHEGNHYNGYVNGLFSCSGDTINEVYRTLVYILTNKEEF